MEVIKISSIIFENVTKNYDLKTGMIKQIFGSKNVVNAVNDVSFQIKKGEIIGLIGESGCGKTTLGKLLMKIEDISSGNIIVNEKNINDITGKDKRKYRQELQMIFQDPFDSLNPKMSIYDILSEPLRSLSLIKKEKDIREKVIETLNLVNLSPAERFLDRYPHRLSGGQRQRVAIARALIVDPDFIVADEPVSMLDVSIRAGILNLLKKINQEKGVGILFITHDLSTAKYLCDRLIVMYLGEIKELLPTSKLITENQHPYTKLLLSSVPDLERPKLNKVKLKGEASNAVVPPKGCRFYPRCPFAEERCSLENQVLIASDDNHEVACWKWEKIKDRTDLTKEEFEWLERS